MHSRIFEYVDKWWLKSDILDILKRYGMNLDSINVNDLFDDLLYALDRPLEDAMNVIIRYETEEDDDD